MAKEKLWGILGVISGAISVIPFPFLGFFAPPALIFAIIAMIKRQLALGVTALVLSVIGFVTSPALWAAAIGLWMGAYCMVADCETIVRDHIAKPVAQGVVQGISEGLQQAGGKPSDKPVCMASYKPIEDRQKLSTEELGAISGYVNALPVDKWDSPAKIGQGSIVYRNSKLAKDGQLISTIIDERINLLKTLNVGMVSKRTEGQQTKDGYPVTIVQLGGLGNNRFEVVSFIDNPCFMIEYVMSSPTREAFEADFPTYFDAVTHVSITKSEATVTTAPAVTLPMPDAAAPADAALEAPAAPALEPPALPAEPAPAMQEPMPDAVPAPAQDPAAMPAL